MVIRFGSFILDLDTRQVKHGAREVHLSPKAFELLRLLVLERPKVLSKAALQQHLWPDTFVAEANLSNLVAEIREGLNDRPRQPEFIRTAHGFGYAFCGTVCAEEHVGDEHSAPPACWIEWGRRRFPLTVGENVVGRDPEAAVHLESSTVSRRHALLTVAPDGTTLEDCGSKNGTFRGNVRVTAPVRLNNGDDIGFGSLLVTFHIRGPDSTQTVVRATT